MLDSDSCDEVLVIGDDGSFDKVLDDGCDEVLDGDGCDEVCLLDMFCWFATVDVRSSNQCLLLLNLCWFERPHPFMCELFIPFPSILFAVDILFHRPLTKLFNILFYSFL